MLNEYSPIFKSVVAQQSVDGTSLLVNSLHDKNSKLIYYDIFNILAERLKDANVQKMTNVIFITFLNHVTLQRRITQ